MNVPIVPLVVATALFMENTDSTILATALPTIARDLGLDPISLKLAVTSYLVSLAVFIPVSGWVADRVGAVHDLPPGARRVHDRLDRLRVLQLAQPVRVLAGGAGPGRGHDGAGRPHGGDPHGAEGRAGAGAFLHRHAGADRADAGAAAGRAHRHVRGLALDLLRQHPDRRPRHRAGDAVHPRPQGGDAAPRHQGLPAAGVGLRRPDPGHRHAGAAHRPAGGGGGMHRHGRDRAAPLLAPRA